MIDANNIRYSIKTNPALFIFFLKWDSMEMNSIMTACNFKDEFKISLQRLFIITLLFTGLFSQSDAQVITSEERIANQEQQFIKSDNKSDLSYIRLTAGYSDNLNSYDPLVIYFDIKATKNFDGQLDALKLFNTDLTVTNFYSFGDDGSRLSINSLPFTYENPLTVRLGLKTERDGEVVFNIRDIVGDFYYKEISLYDLVTGVKQDILPGKQYKVTLSAGHYQDRFYLNLSNIPTGISIPYDNKDKINIYSYHKTLFARINTSNFRDGWLSIINLSGQILHKYEINGPGEYQFNPELTDGIYILSFSSGSVRITKKIYILQ